MWRRNKAETIGYLIKLTGVDKMLANKSWKTTVLGICGILTAVVTVVSALIGGTAVNWEVTIASVTAGVGLILARDNNRTSEDVSADVKDAKK